MGCDLLAEHPMGEGGISAALLGMWTAEDGRRARADS